MQIISDGKQLSDLLCNLVENCEKFSFAVAWATQNNVYSQIYKNRNKILQATIGTHFFQTAPQVLQDFLGYKNLHFVFETNGVFHPKVYLFKNKNKWHLIIGSANLTQSAFTINQEAVIYMILDEKNEADLETIKSVKNMLKDMYKQGRTILQSEVNTYTEMQKIHKNKIKSLSSIYENTQTKHLSNALSCKLQNMTWKQYLAKVYSDDKYDSIDTRCSLLSHAYTQFYSHIHFSEISDNWRKAIAATVRNIPEALGLNVGYFGSMQGAGVFKNLIATNSIHLSNALDCISLVGNIDKFAYDSYIEHFLRAFPNGRDGLATATRLLALKRPDQFLCIDGQNLKALAQEFRIKQSILKNEDRYENYWNSIILRIRDSIWWNEKYPSNNQKQQQYIWKGRVAMLDTIFYIEKQEMNTASSFI